MKEGSEGLILFLDTGNHCRICHKGIIARLCILEKLFWNSSYADAEYDNFKLYEWVEEKAAWDLSIVRPPRRLGGPG